MAWWLLVLSLVQAGVASTPSADGVVTGRIVDAASNAPVPAAAVSIHSALSSSAPTMRVLTDDEGRYFFDQLLAGPYTISVTKPGWVAGAYGRRRFDGPETALKLADHEMKSGVDVQLWKYGVISGTIVDDAGEPMVNLEVRAVRRTLTSGKRPMRFVGTAHTDDRGMYRIAGLTPGEYSVFVPATVVSGVQTFPLGGASPEWLRTMTGEGTAPMSFDFQTGVAARSGGAVVSSLTGVSSAPAPDAAWMAIPPSFAGAQGVAGAATFKILSGQERNGADMQLRMAPTYSVSGVLTMPGGSASGLALHLMSGDLVDYPLFDVATATTDGSGAFTFFGVPPGDYVVRVVRMPLASGQRLAVVGSLSSSVAVLGGGPGALPPPVATEPLLYATERVTVGAAPVRGLQVTMRSGPRITGHAEFNGTASQPTPQEWSRMRVSLEHANGYQSQNSPYGQFTADGNFSTPGLLPGDYYVRVQPPPGWTVKSVTWQGHNILDAPLALASTDVADVVVSFTDHAGSLSGSVYGANDAPDATALVLIFPTDREEWTDYGVRSPRMTSERVDVDGAFRTGKLPEGEYFMIAVPDESASDWQDPVTLATLAASAKRVAVRDGEMSRENLKLERIR